MKRLHVIADFGKDLVMAAPEGHAVQAVGAEPPGTGPKIPHLVVEYRHCVRRLSDELVEAVKLGSHDCNGLRERKRAPRGPTRSNS